MTTDCYCNGSEELDSLFRCRYTSVPYLFRGERKVCVSAPVSLLFITKRPTPPPKAGVRPAGLTYPSMLISFRSPPKYRAYSLDMGSP